MSSIQNPAIQPGSWILVTGVNGFVASHIADQLLLAGYKVRGTVRNVQKNSWMAQHFESKYGKGVFELLEVKDMSQESALDGAIKGVSGVAHVASVVTFDSDPNKVIPQTIAFALNALKAAAREPSVKRFVYTSSIVAVYVPAHDAGRPVDEKMWNEAAVEAAWHPPPYGPERAMAVYGASKTQGEQAVWRWLEENRPGLVVNTVVPAAVIGPAVDVKNQGHASTSSGVVDAYKQEWGFWAGLAPGIYVDVQDVARLHVAALIHPDVKNERVFGCAAPFTWDDVYAVFRKLYPESEGRWPAPDPDAPRDTNEILPAERAEGLLRELGRPGWVGLEESVRGNLEGVVA